MWGMGSCKRSVCKHVCVRVAVQKLYGSSSAAYVLL